MTEKTFYILSLDGGGIRGIYQSHILRKMEEEMGVNLQDKFDLVVGTSTGAINAGAIACGIKMGNVVNMYKNESKNIFPKKFMNKLNFIFNLIYSKYDQNYLEKSVEEIIGDIKFQDLKHTGKLSSNDPRLCIVSADINSGKMHLFKSPYVTPYSRDGKILIRQAIIASCSAPLLFPPYSKIDETNNNMLIDGGIVSNNPILHAVADIANIDKNANTQNTKILSIGCGSTSFINKTYYKKSTYCMIDWMTNKLGWGLLTKWKAGKLIDYIIALQTRNANDIAKKIMKEKNILRIEDHFDREIKLDNPQEIEYILARSNKDYSKHCDTIKQFLDI